MAIVQISKIQQRTGNVVDLPQLDNAELGWASDARQLFIGNDNNITGVENVEVLTSYSTIDFDQINGSYGNLDIDGANIANGQVLTYDGNNWTNRGGNIGGLITLGDVSNLKINGGAIGYVLETDGTGNLAWTPKSTITAYIQNATQTNPCVITTTDDNFFVDAQEVTITNVPGMTQLNGNSYYVNALTSNTFSLYSDISFTTPVDATGFTAFPYTSVSATSSSLDQVTVGNATPFTVNDPVVFVGNTDQANSNIVEGQIYYVLTKDTSAPNTWITLSATVGGSTLQLGDSTITANVYASGGRAIAAVGGSGTVAAAGSNTSVQYNNNNIIDGDGDFTWNFAGAKVLTVNGNANVGNLNATTSVITSVLISNVTTGTAPLTVSSTTRVANLNVNYANVSDFEVVTAQTTGTFYPVFVNGNTTANYALGSNANISFNAATGNLSTNILNANGNANVGNLGTGGLIVATGNITGGNINSAGNVTASRLISNIATGTAPLTVTSTTRVANLNVNYANVSDFEVVTTQTTGTFYPTFVNANTTGNLALGSNANLSFNAATGALSATLLTGTLTTAAQPNITSLGTLTSLTVSNTSVNASFVNFNGIEVPLKVTGSSTGFVQGAVCISSGIADSPGSRGQGVFLFNEGNDTTWYVGTAYSAADTFYITRKGSTTSLDTAAAQSIYSLLSLSNTGALSVPGNISGGNVTGTLLTGTLTTAAQPNVTSLGTLTTLNVNSTANAVAFSSNVATGTAPLTVSSTTKVTNLNADLLDGYDASSGATAATIALRTGDGSIFANLLYGTLATAAQPNVTSVGTLTSLIVSGTANLGSTLTTLLTTGANSTAGTITGNWALSAGSRLIATYADLAEYYSADQDYEPGTVLEFGGEQEVTLASDGSNKVAGVVSTNPAYVMNGLCTGVYPVAIALQGRVPVKVRGKINKGDLMVSGGNGYARPSNSPQIGTVIGKSLQNFEGVEGIIEIAVGRL